MPYVEIKAGQHGRTRQGHTSDLYRIRWMQSSDAIYLGQASRQESRQTGSRWDSDSRADQSRAGAGAGARELGSLIGAL
jgi:hypothetical protein